MGQPKLAKCDHCQSVLPSHRPGDAVLKFCPFCGKPLPQPKLAKPVKSPSHLLSLEQRDDGYILPLGESSQVSPQGDAPSDQTIKTTDQTPADAQEVTGQPPSDSADLLSLDVDLLQAQEEEQSSKPQIQEKSSKPKPPPESSVSENRPVSGEDSHVLLMLSETVLPQTESVVKEVPEPNAANDTLAGLEDEEDQLDLAMAEEVVELTADSDDDLGDATVGLDAAAGTVDKEFELDCEIKPQETAPIVGLNMLQQQVGRSSSWDRVPLPELAAASEKSSVYELAVEPEVAAGKTCPACHAKMTLDAVVCSTCGYNVQLGRYVEGLSGDPMGEDYGGAEHYLSVSEKYEADQEYYHRQHLLHDVYIPTVVLLAMLVFLVFTVMVISPYEMVPRSIVEKVIPSKPVSITPVLPKPGTIASVMRQNPMRFMAGFVAPPPPLTVQQRWFCIAYLFGTNLLQIAIKIPFIFMAMMLVIRLFGVSFGGIFTAITKILGIAMAAHVITFFIDSVLFVITEGVPLMGLGSYVSFPFTVVTFMGLTMKFFELDVQEAIVMFLASYLLPMFAAMLVLMWGVTLLT